MKTQAARLATRRHPRTAAECAHAAALDQDVRVVVATLTGARTGRVVSPAWAGRVSVWLDGGPLMSYRTDACEIA